MADKIKIDIAASYDDKEAKQALKDAEKLDSTKVEMEIDADVDRALNAFDEVISESKRVQAAADALATALGPELTAKADPTAIVQDLRQMGLTLDQISSNADVLAAKLKEASDVDIGGKLGSSLGTTRGKMDELGASASSSKSVLANMVGNATQDLGALGGVAGSAGVAIGQMGEYMADARAQGESFGSIVNNFSAIVGPVAALSIGVGLVTKAWTDYKEKQKAVQEAIRDTSEGLADALDIVDDFPEKFDEATTAYEAFADVLLGNDADRDKVIGFLADLGLTLEDLPGLIDAIATSDPDVIGQLIRDLGGSKEAADAVADLVREGTGLSKINSNADLLAWVDKFDDKSRDAILSVSGLADEINGLQPNEAAGVMLDRIATSSPAARDAIAALRREMPDASNVEILNAYSTGMHGVEASTAAAKAQQEDYVTWLIAQGEANKAAADAASAEADEIQRAADASDNHRDAIARVNMERERVDARAELRRERDAADDVTEAYQRLHDEISNEESLINLKRSFQDVETKAVEAFDAVKTGAKEAETKVDDHRLAWLRAKDDVISYIESIDGIPKNISTAIEILYDKGDYDSVLAALDRLDNPRTVEIRPQLPGSRYAAGGIGGGRALVGEDGPEIVDLPMGARVYPASVSSAMMHGSSGTFTVNVNMPKGSRGVDVVRQIAGQARRSGRRYGTPVVHYARR